VSGRTHRTVGVLIAHMGRDRRSPVAAVARPVPAAAGVRRLRHSLRAGGLARAVAAYFSPEEDFAGLSFTCLGSNPRDAVTASDLLAVSLLDIAWRPEAVSPPPNKRERSRLSVRRN